MSDFLSIPAEARVVLQTIRARRRIQQIYYLPDPVPQEYLEMMLEAANWAPTHGQTEPWRFTVFAGEARRALGEKFAESYRLGTPPEAFEIAKYEQQLSRVWKVPLWIALGMQVGTNPKIPEWEEVAAVAAAVQNMQLVARSLGLGTFWASGMPVRHENTARFVGLEPPHKLLGFLMVGYPAIPWPEGKRGDWREKVSWRLG
ncbi:MAG: nitroreductase [Meiothermus silvanus]|nr:nitroreductase [Allomeiothermus silvanus]